MIAPHVGGGFGSKGRPHAHDVLAVPGRPRRGRPRRSSCALTRQQMFSLAGYRTPTLQRVRLGADARRARCIALGPRGRSSRPRRIKEFAEQTATPTRIMYAVDRHAGPRTGWRRSTCRSRPGCVRPARAPACSRCESRDGRARRSRSGSTRSSCASATSPRSIPSRASPSRPATSSSACAQGAERFGWADRDPRRAQPGPDGRWLVGTGVAASTYPVYRMPGSAARHRRAAPTAATRCAIGAADIGTGTWTALAQIAADALGVPLGARASCRSATPTLPHGLRRGRLVGHRLLGHRRSCDAARELRAGTAATARTPGPTATGDRRPQRAPQDRYAMHAFGAQFVEVRRGRRHRRDAGARGCSACSPPAGSSTRAPPARSSSAA